MSKRTRRAFTALHPFNGTVTHTSYSVGPVGLNVELCKKHGWSDKQILRAEDALAKLSRKEGGIAQRRHPELFYTTFYGLTIFVGDLSPAAKRKIVRLDQKGRSA